MYLHPAFEISAKEALPILQERAFGLFVVPTSKAPFGVHVPFLVSETEAGALRVELHVARANPIHEEIAGHTEIGGCCQALLACQGPDAYISPDWYGIDDQVPTWTYVSVHLKGVARVRPMENNLDHVDRLTDIFEERLSPKVPWTSDKMDTRKRDMMMHAIVSIELEVETIEAQKKLIQHKGKTEHDGAIAGLRARPDQGSQQIADLMQKTANEKFQK